MGNQALTIIQNVTEALLPWWGVLSLVAYFFGFCLVIVGLLSMASQEQMGRSLNIKKPALAIAIGIIMINLFPFLNVLAASTFGGESANALSYTPNNVDAIQGSMLRFSIYVTMLIGLSGVIKGLYGIYNSGQDPREFFPSLAYVFGGFAAVNVRMFFQILGATAGGTVQTTISSFLS